MYDLLETAQARLGGTLVLYKGEPAYVMKISGMNANIRVTLRRTYGEDNSIDFTVPLRDPNLAVNTFKLGYVNNTDGYVYFAARKPLRRYKQGLAEENVTFLSSNGLENAGVVSIFKKEFGNMLTGRYPSLNDALEQVKGGYARQIAFHKRMFVEQDPLGIQVLYYRNKKIGYSEGSFNFKLKPDQFFLKEQLQESGVQLCA
jgi:hypothetical protein